MPEARGHEHERQGERSESTLLRRSTAGPSPPADPPSPSAQLAGGRAPVQLFSIPGAFDTAIRKIPQVDKGLNKLNSHAKVKKAAKVASFLGFKIPFVDRPKPGGGGGDGGGGGGGGDSECCKSPFPENRHDASQHDPEANKSGPTPEGPDQTAEPSAEEPKPAPKAPADKSSDLVKSKEWSEARKIFETTPAPRRSVKSINQRTKERFARSRLHPTDKATPVDETGAAPAKASVKDRVLKARQEKVAAALSGESPARTRTPSPVAAAVKGQLGKAGVGHQGILASARQDMHGRQADRFQLHLDAAKGRAENLRPQQEAARRQAIGSVSPASLD